MALKKDLVKQTHDLSHIKQVLGRAAFGFLAHTYEKDSDDEKEDDGDSDDEAPVSKKADAGASKPNSKGWRSQNQSPRWVACIVGVCPRG